MATTMEQKEPCSILHQSPYVFTHRLKWNALATTDFDNKHRWSFTRPQPLQGITRLLCATPATEEMQERGRTATKLDANRGTAGQWFRPGQAYSSSPARHFQHRP